MRHCGELAEPVCACVCVACVRTCVYMCVCVCVCARARARVRACEPDCCAVARSQVVYERMTQPPTEVYATDTKEIKACCCIDKVSPPARLDPQPHT